MTTPSFYGDEIPLESHIIEVRIRKLRQLFDSLDPSPFIALDLDDDAQQYIVGSAKVLPPHLPLALVVHVREPDGSPEEARDAGEAIREHFKRQSGFASLQLRDLIHDGWISLAIGLAFLSVALTASAALLKWAPTTPGVGIFREGLIICGWVAMWRPIQIFLYEWWPILGDRRLFDRLARMPVQMVAPPAPE
ncbi:MAG TPA: hypothetical protein DCM68_04500 [Verrucomicrobia bacterium]|nr:hypothetical protein [Verrucomicrobiota bacterium]